MIVNKIGPLLESSYTDCLNPYLESIGLTESCMTVEMFNLECTFSFPDTRTILVFLSTCLLFSVYLHRRRAQQRLPPGPWHLPLIGSLLPVAVKLYRTGQEAEHLLAGMSKKYGEVFSLSIGTKIIIVVSGCGAIKEAFQNQHINDRPESEFLQNVGVDTGVIVTSGQSWKYQRALTLNIFRAFGVGRSRFVTNIVKEAEVLILGHRVCLGENLAKMEVFLFFTSILRSFNITSPSDGKPISMEGVSGATFSPEPFDIIATKRQ